jgi:GPH family glycoside/pentoside/hexuronide:cation symporter
MQIPLAIHLTIFYSDTVLVPLGLVAVVKAVARCFDALSDPIVGWLSDRTRSRLGRRRPWIAIGAPLAALAFWALFTPPEGLGAAQAASWLALTYVLYYIFHTVYAIPHYGLGPELTLDYHERNLLFGWREGFTVAGTMVAAVLPPLLIAALGSVRGGYTGFALVFGVLLVALYWNLVAQVRERPEFAQREPNPLVPGIRRVMRNRVFRILLFVYVVGSITGAIPGLMMPYYTKYVLKPEDPDRWLGIFLFIYFGAGFLFLPVWVWAARRFEKKPVWLASFLPGFAASVSMFFLGEGDLLPAALILAGGGMAFGAGLFLGPSMQADVIDYDELYTGKRREAQYGALWSIMSKFTVIPSASIPLSVLASVGYVPNQPQGELVEWTIRAIFGLAPAATALVAFVFALLYPINRAVHQKIWEGIERHRRGEAAVDPLSGRLLAPPTGRGVDEDTGWYLDHFSLRELRRALAAGPAAVTRGIATRALGALALCAGAAVLSTRGVDLHHEPGFMSVLWIVAAGVCFAAFLYHAIRLAAARRLASVDPRAIRTHVEGTQAMLHGLPPSPAPAPAR